MGKTQLEKSEAANRQISSDTKHNSKQILEKANEHPEWLPDGWIVDYRTRKSGANMGYGYKCYIDPNGNKFYSKPEVLRYLETMKDNSCTSKKEERCNTNSCTSQKEERCNTNSIPSKKEERCNTNSIPSKEEERCNTNSCTSKKEERFNTNSCTSQKEERCNTNSIPSKEEERCNTNSIPSKKEERCNTMHSSNKDTVEKSTVEDLPPGWIKEVKYRKGGNGNKKDMFYTDPVSGYVFRSKKDVLRYLESGDISTCVLKPNKRQIQDEDKLTPSSAGKRQKLKQSAIKRRLFVGKEISDEGSLGLPDANSSEKGQDVNVSSDQLTNNVTSEQTLQAPKRSLRKGRTVLDTDLANKSTQQLNGVPESERSHKMQGDIPLNKSSMLSEGQAVYREQLHQLGTGKIDDKPEQNQYSLSGDSSLPNLKVAMKTIRAELPSPDNPHNSHGLASEALVLKENKLLASETGKRGEIHSNSNKSSNKKEQWISRRASKRLAGFEPELMSNSVSNERAPEYKSKKSKVEVNAALQRSVGGPAMELAGPASVNGESSNKSIKPSKIPPIANDQLEKLEDEELNDDKSEAQQSFAFHYSWSDPNLEFAIKTLTGALHVEDSVGNGHIRIPEADMSPKNKLFENVAGSSSDKIPKVSSSKSKNKKELKKEPTRLSKRLAGHEPEVLPAERALEYATRKLSKDKPTATAVLTDRESEHLHAGEESKLIAHASDRLKTSVCGESSNEGEKSFDVQTVPNERVQRPEAENIDDDRSEPQFPLPFGDTWSDPCLEFAIKTLTGDLPDADILPVMTPDVNDQPNEELLESVVQKSNEEAHDNAYQPPTNKEVNTVCQPSKQLLSQPELRVSSTCCENDLKFAARESHSDEGNITRNLDGGESLHIEAGHMTQVDINTLILEEPLKENEQVLEGESVKEQPQPGTETINHYISETEREFCASFMDSWSDPCLEFAFKTLTGAIPLEENTAIQGRFQEPAHPQDQRNGRSTLPEFGSSSISQSDISFYSDIGEKPLPGQQASMSYSFPTAEKSSLHGYTRVDPQKQYSQCNNNFQR